MRVFMYLRRSQDTEDRQVLSIPAQERVLGELAERRGLRVVGDPYRESMTARKPGRPLFNDMMRRLEHGDADGVLCWKIDRLARNPVDAGRITWALGQKQFGIIVTTETDYSGSGDDKLFMSIMFGMATKFCDDLSENVKRGNREAVERGYWPAAPKLGYIRDFQTRRLVPDPTCYAAVKRLFELRLLGLPMVEIHRIARDELHLRTRKRRNGGERVLVMSQIYELMRDPFYAGVVSYQGMRYPGNHEPMITVDQFERIRRGIGRADLATLPRPKTLYFPYRGLIRCGCGSLVTAEKKLKRNGRAYHYYRCCKKIRPNRCEEDYVSEPALEAQIEAFLGTLVVPLDVAQAVVAAVGRADEAAASLRETARAAIQKEHGAVVRRTDRLTQMRIDDEISADEYAAMRRDVTERKALLDAKLREFELEISNHGVAERILRWVDFGNRAAEQFRKGDPTHRRRLVAMLISNLRLTHGTLLCEAKKPLSWFLDFRPILAVQAQAGDVSNFVDAIARGILTDTPSVPDLAEHTES